MEAGDSGLLARAEIHGFLTAADLDVDKLMEDASTRWFRPNEVHAILSNYTLFKIQPQPIDKPTSGRLLLFDRKMLRNFRKDRHNWKKKKDGKTVQEAHEKLKIGNVERIHVYYARSEDDPNFYRRCYWLLDKNLEHIVLVHYRQTSEDNVFQYVPPSKECTEALSLRSRMQDGSSATPVNSASGSEQSDVSGLAGASDEIDSCEYDAGSTGVSVPFTAGCGNSMLDSCSKLQNHELSLHEINTLEWEELVGSTAPNFSPLISQNPSNITSGNGLYGVDQLKDLDITLTPFRTGYPNSQVEAFDLDVICSENKNTHKDGVLITHNNFGSWNCINDNSLGFLDKLQHQTQKSVDDETKSTVTSFGDHIFTVTEVSPCWSYCTEETKVLVVGNFCESKKHLMSSSIYCVIGDLCTKAEMVHPGVYRCIASPQPPGLMNFFLTMDGHTPISQVLSFDCRCLPNKFDGLVTSSEDDYDKMKRKHYEFQKRLAYLLFATSNNISILSSRIPPKSLDEVKSFVLQTSPLIERDWINFLNLDNANETSSSSFKEDFLELVLRSKFNEWLLVRVAEGRKGTVRDNHGQGVIHLCAILDYKWAIRPYALSGLSLDFRDIHGWTPLHWAAHYGREKMVAALLLAGANPSLVTDPNKESHGGSTAADLASKQGYEGLAAYLAEKGLTAHFQAMTLSGNISPHGQPLSTATATSENDFTEYLSEQELCLKESLAAYRNAANAADRIQSAMRDRALRLQTKAVQLVKPEMEAAQIVAALKIQYAFRKYNRRRMMKAAARIQSHFRTWKIRRNFMNMRKKTIKIQSIFRGHQVRKQYRKLVWSVGVLEKVILRWRLKKKGLRGIQVETTEAMSVVDTTPESTGEEDFYRISREQAEERVQRSVVRVQSMFRSYQAQQEYRRMRMAYEQAKLEFCDLNQQ